MQPRFRPNIATMSSTTETKHPTVSKYMTREILAVAPNTSIDTVIRLFHSHDFTGLPVIGPAGEALGIVTHADLFEDRREVSASSEYGVSLFYQITDGWASTHGDAKYSEPGCASEIMRPIESIVSQDTPLWEAAAQLVQQKTRRLIVVNNGAITGIITTRDFVAAFVALHAEASIDGALVKSPSITQQGLLPSNASAAP
jgi:CBS domain-containing protein